MPDPSRDTDTPSQTVPPLRSPRQDAGQDESIRRRLRRNPDDEDARIDAGVDESMDASDPPATSVPGAHRDPALPPENGG